MSFLDELKLKKRNLNKVDTVITQVDGRKFIETTTTTNSGEQRTVTVSTKPAQYGYVVDLKPDNIPVKIFNSIYLGSQDCCCDLKTLIDHNITSVLSVGIDAPIKFNDITYKFVQCLDLPETNLIDDGLLTECVDFLIDATKKQYNNVLVHCNAGVSRSASIVIGYLILVEHFTYLDAYQIVKRARNCIQPNSGFERQLKSLYCHLSNNSSSSSNT